MSYSVWFDVSLNCCQCNRQIPGKNTEIYSSGLLLDPIDISIQPGEKIEIESAEFWEAYFEIKNPEGDRVWIALEQWACPQCKSPQWAKIYFQKEASNQFLFLSAECVLLNPNTLKQIHFITRKIEYWIKDNPGPETETLFEVLRRDLW